MHSADGDLLVARARPKQRAQHLRPRSGQRGVAARRHDRRQALDALGMLDGDDLRDHPAHRRPDDMGLGDAERVHQPDRVARHVVQGIGRPDRQVKEGARHHGRRRERAGRRHAGRKADVAVVEADDAKAARGEPFAERFGPRHQLHAEAHDEQDDRRVAPSGLGVFDGDAVRPYRGHLPSPS